MKKLTLLFVFLFMFSINYVNASTINVTYNLLNENFTGEENLSIFTNHEVVFKKLFEDIYETYISNYSESYPYYSIYYDTSGACIECNDETSDLRIYMNLYSSLPTLELTSESTSTSYILADKKLKYYYSVGKNAYVTPIEESEGPVQVMPFQFNYHFSNFDLIINSDENTIYNIITYPSTEYTFTLTNGDTFPTAFDFFNISFLNDYTSNENSFIEVNLNEYSYVALSLKDYNTIPESSYSTYVNFSVKGKLCVTPVYNYGQTERKDIINGTQVQACSNYYNNFTNVRFYILPDDVKNHAIYYLKAYDTSKENIVKINSSVFSISYITEESKDNPEVLIEGKLYPTLSYDSLNDTATKSEDEGYISGVTCAIGDLNCYTEYNPENVFDTLFEKPLETLKNIWSSITGIFDIITEFISLLPEDLQACLYLSFVLGLILGILKIIL